MKLEKILLILLSFSCMQGLIPIMAAERVTTDSVVTATMSEQGAGLAEKYTPEFDLKTNLLHDAVGTMNMGGEVKLSPRASLELSVDWNPWTFSGNTIYKEWIVAGELRWWPRQGGEWTDSHGHGNTALNGHFLGVHIMGGEFNYNRITLPFNAYPLTQDYRHEGWLIGGGFTYGYRYNVSSRFALEASVGVGVLHIDYSRYGCGRCDERLSKGKKLYVGPTRAALSLILRIGKNPRKYRGEQKITTINKRVVVTREIFHTDTVVEVAAAEMPPVAEAKGKIRSAGFTLRLTYPVNSSVIVPALGNNAAQLDSLNNFLHSYSRNKSIEIKSIDILGYASVEGNAMKNLVLSRRRADSAATLVRESYPSLGGLVAAKGLGEDWESLHFPEKRGLMQIADPDERERRMKNIDGGRLYEDLLRNSFPATRRIECVINYTLVE